MPVIHVHSDGQFDQELSRNSQKLVVVDFTATWCGPCKMIAPIFEQLSNTYSWGAVFLKIDVDECQDISGREGVRAMPTFKFYKNKSCVATIQGANPRGLEDKIVELIGSKPRPSTPPPPRYAPMWHQGSNIGHAIAQAKSANKMFMVFIDDDSDSAKKMADIVERAEHKVTQLTIALRLKANEANARHFGQIYPLIVQPSIYLITNDGTPVEIIAGDLSDETFLEKLIKANALHLERIENASQQTQVSSQSSGSVSQEPAAKKQEESTSTSTEDTANLTMEEKLKRATERLDKLKKQREQELIDKEKQGEVSRRETGKAMQEAKRKREELELQELAAKRDKEKREDAEARRRVLEQIAQDRADRKAREERERLAQQQPTAPAAACEMRPPKVDANSSRIQFKLPDGSTLTQTFAADANLIEAHNFLTQKANLRRFTLSQTYPRKNFGEEDYSKSFRDLELLPSAVLLVLSNSSGNTVANAGPSLYSFLMTLLSPLFAVWAYIQTFFGAQTPAENPQQPTASGSGQAQNPRKRPSNTPITRQGNIARLRNADDDDENNTWNGNSTQQM